MSNIIISDASCLIALEKIGRLHLLKDVFEIIFITEQVMHEFSNELPNWIRIASFNNQILY